MSSSSRSPRSSPSPRWLPWVISVALHLVVIAWWASLPEPPPRIEPEKREPIEIEWIEVERVDRVEQVEVPPASVPGELEEPELEEPELEEPKELPAAGSATARDDARPGDEVPGEPEPASSEPASSEPSGTDKRPGGVALFGLRDDSRPGGPRGSLRPTLPPPGPNQVVRQAASTSALGPAPRDGKPRSFAEAGFRRRRNGKMVYIDRRAGFRATVLPDGRLKFRITIPLPGGMPGMSEMVRSAQGQELAQSRKKKLLEATFDLRLQMAVSFARDKIDRRLKSLYRELLDGWKEHDKSEAERREALFRRWDECEEGGPVSLPGFDEAAISELDEMRRDGGQRARKTIERFIRRQLPPESPQAYGEAELRRLNGSRISRERFEPYSSRRRPQK